MRGSCPSRAERPAPATVQLLRRPSRPALLCAGAAAGACLWLAPVANAGQLARVSAAQAKPNAAVARAWQPNVGAAVAYAHTRAGAVSFAVRTERRQWGWRVTRTVPSASVLKAMLLVAYLDDRRVRGRALGTADHRLIDPMIQRSDNEAATRVLGFVGAPGVYAVARRAGMRRFALDPTVWGLSRIDAADQARFFLHIDGDVVSRHRVAAMHLLATVVPAQRWGIGRLHLSGWQVYFKGGWGAGTGEVEHQVVLLRHGPVRVSAAVLITDSPSHAYAKQTLQGLLTRLLRGVGRLIVAPAPVAAAPSRGDLLPADG
jgi:Beta-lactamase enzyme family